MRNSLRVGVFLALRYIRRANKWASALTVFVMMLTFLNLVMITGVLVGLIAGAEKAYIGRHTGDVFVSTYPNEQYIKESPLVLSVIQSTPGIAAFSPRYVVLGKIEAGYQRRAADPQAVGDTVGANVTGINVEKELSVTHINEKMIEGSFLSPGDEDEVVMGATLFERYTPGDFGFGTLGSVYPGDKIRLTINGVTREVTLKGIIKSKADATDLGVFMLDSEVRKFVGRTDYGLNEIAIRLSPGVDPASVRDALKRAGVSQYGLVRTGSESLGQFLAQIETTFALLGNIIGLTSLAVASITIFIVIFVTAITRKKFIGILKGIGVSGSAIEISYVILALMYAAFGISIGATLLFVVFVPYFAAHPINFPFSDGILAVTVSGTLWRTLLIAAATVIAGYIPAKIIVRKDALEAMRG
jgi:ABC-type lipoprotein release transport system permease subunit